MLQRGRCQASRSRKQPYGSTVSFTSLTEEHEVRCVGNDFVDRAGYEFPPVVVLV